MRKKKGLSMISLIIIIAAVLTGCGKSGQEAGTNDGNKPLEGTEFNLYTWDGMFPQEVLDGFEDETGVKINYSNFDYNEDMLAKLEEAKGGDYDFIIADDYILELIKEENLYQALDKSKLSNWENINPLYQGQFYDPEDEFTVPFGAGIPLIVYDPELVDIKIEGYADLWDPSLKDNVALIGNYRVVNGIALKTMGESFNTNDLDVISQAGEKLKELAPNVRVINDSNTQDFLLTGEVGAAFLYTSQVYEALKANEDLEVVYPKEGLGFGVMAGFIPSDAPNADAAYAFINYLLDPEISAQCFEYLGYYCTTKAAEEYISEDMQKFIVVPDTVTEGESIQNISDEAEQLHSEIWNEFKNTCD